jgi:hypothetical protein
MTAGTSVNAPESKSFRRKYRMGTVDVLYVKKR